jgi:hypothetical protein
MDKDCPGRAVRLNVEGSGAALFFVGFCNDSSEGFVR